MIDPDNLEIEPVTAPTGERTSLALSPDQASAMAACLTALSTDRRAVLTGPAGSGKTTLVRAILNDAPWEIRLAAPTGKASRRLGTLVGMPAQTIHRLMYAPPNEKRDKNGDLVFSHDPKKRFPDDALLVVDEASMVGRRLAGDLYKWLPESARILWVGDREQLEPVKDTWGADLARPTAALTQVHRQALENPIIAFATAVREGHGDEWIRAWTNDDPRIHVSREGMKSAVSWYVANRRNGAAICFTHACRRSFNDKARKALNLGGDIAPGDRLLVKKNDPALDIVNGDVLEVQSVGRLPDDGHYLVQTDGPKIAVNVDLFDKEQDQFYAFRKGLLPWDRDLPWAHVWRGECLTVHSSQGSQWTDVAFLWDNGFQEMRKRDPAGARRLLYTAVTRAADNLAVFAGQGL